MNGSKRNSRREFTHSFLTRLLGRFLGLAGALAAPAFFHRCVAVRAGARTLPIMATVDKLSLIQDELGILGENVPAVADDGSPEWNVCSPAYEAAVAETIQSHDWSFETQIATLARIGPSPDDLYTDAMALPNGCLQLIWVQLEEPPIGTGNRMPVDYKIIGNQICLRLREFTAVAKFVVDPQIIGTGVWPPLFARIIRHRIRAAICFGLKEDDEAGFKWDASSEAILQMARTRVDQQQPKRATFNSRAITARYVRRPFQRTPFPFGGTGTPN